ncbi:hypothetical protein BJX96DRAFT_144984 [Aspergillus floccosus]
MLMGSLWFKTSVNNPTWTSNTTSVELFHSLVVRAGRKQSVEPSADVPRALSLHPLPNREKKKPKQFV